MDRESRITRLRREYRRSPHLRDAEIRKRLRRAQKLAQKDGESSKKKGETMSAGGNDDEDDDVDGETKKEGSGCDSPVNLKCSQCEAWCTSLEEMEEHIARVHPAGQPLQCPYCDDFQCLYILSMQIHLQEVHDAPLE